MSSPGPTPARRYPTLDVLRLVAIGMTVLVHMPSLRQSNWLLRPFNHSFWLGVDLFMLISGWLVGSQLLREAQGGPINARRFYIRRWFRTLPPYYVVLAVVLFMGPKSAPSPLTTLSHFAFLQTYFPPNLYGVSWSLCVEEHFYLLLPVLVALLMRRPTLPRLLGLIAAQELVALVARGLAYGPNASQPYATHVRSDGLFLGLFFAWMHLARPQLWEKIGRFTTPLFIAGTVSTLLLMTTGAPSTWSYVALPTIGTWSLALIFLPCVHDASPLSRITFPGLMYLGELTYSAYLIHAAIPEGWVHAFRGASVGVPGLAWRGLLVVGLSVALHHTVERPALRLRQRLMRASPIATHAQKVDVAAADQTGA